MESVAQGIPQKAQIKAYDQSILMTGTGREIERGWKRSVDSLLDLRSIGDNWDGEGATAPFPEIIDSAIDLVRSNELMKTFSLPPPDRIVPRKDGQISLEWFFDSNYVKFHIFAPGRARCMVSIVGAAEEFYSWDWLPKPRGIVWTAV